MAGVVPMQKLKPIRYLIHSMKGLTKLEYEIYTSLNSKGGINENDLVQIEQMLLDMSQTLDKIYDIISDADLVI